MIEKLEYTTLNTVMGWVGILASAKGLTATTLPQTSEGEAWRLLGTGVNQAVRSPARFADLSERLKAYFSGEQTSFPDELDLSGASPFQARVWQATRLIPYGETRSYLQIAIRLRRRRAARAVGHALSKNPLPIIIPCHRVIASNGGLGGFSGGLEMKRQLLRLERFSPVKTGKMP